VTCDDVRALVGGHVLGALEPAEEEAVRAHLSTCTECARAAADMAVVPALLDRLGVGPGEPPADRPPAHLEDAVLAAHARGVSPPTHGEADDGLATGAESRATGRARARRRRWRPALWAGGGLAAGAFLTLVVLFVAGPFDVGGRSTLDAALAGSPAAPGATGHVEMERVDNGCQIDVYVEGLPPSRDGAVYEVWFVRDQGRVSAGTFGVGDDGEARVRLTAAVDPREFSRIGVSLEPNPDDPAVNGPNVLSGSLGYVPHAPY
jgi:hypothetical protein